MFFAFNNYGQVNFNYINTYCRPPVSPVSTLHRTHLSLSFSELCHRRHYTRKPTAQQASLRHSVTTVPPPLLGSYFCHCPSKVATTPVSSRRRLSQFSLKNLQHHLFSSLKPTLRIEITQLQFAHCRFNC